MEGAGSRAAAPPGQKEPAEGAQASACLWRSSTHVHLGTGLMDYKSHLAPECLKIPQEEPESVAEGHLGYAASPAATVT